MGRRVDAGAGELHAGQLPGLDRPVPAQPRRRPARPGAAALPADRRSTPPTRLRRAGHPGRGGRDRRVRRERRDLRRGADRDRPPRHGERADHPERVPAQAAGATCCRPPPQAGVGIIARVPLASGLLCGRYTTDTTFAADDHRTYNRHGEAFDVGETFSGVDYATGVEAAAGVRRAGRRRHRGARRRRPRSPGSSSSRASPRSSPAPARSSRPAPTRPPASCRRWPRSSWPPSATSTTARSGSRCTTAGSTLGSERRDRHARPPLRSGSGPAGGAPVLRHRAGAAAWSPADGLRRAGRLRRPVPELLGRPGRGPGAAPRRARRVHRRGPGGGGRLLRSRGGLGAEVLHEPRLWPEYHPSYYGAFVRDPDGNNVEAVCHTAGGA